MGLGDLKAELSQLDLVDQGPLLQQLSHDQFNFSPLLTPRLQPCCADLVVRASSTAEVVHCLLYTSPSPRDMRRSRMPSSA